MRIQVYLDVEKNLHFSEEQDLLLSFNNLHIKDNNNKLVLYNTQHTYVSINDTCKIISINKIENNVNIVLQNMYDSYIICQLYKGDISELKINTFVNIPGYIEIAENKYIIDLLL